VCASTSGDAMHYVTGSACYACTASILYTTIPILTGMGTYVLWTAHALQVRMHVRRDVRRRDVRRDVQHMLCRCACT
jgi:NO-binding membrane sensor protein with MHYT domain